MQRISVSMFMVVALLIGAFGAAQAQGKPKKVILMTVQTVKADGTKGTRHEMTVIPGSAEKLNEHEYVVKVLNPDDLRHYELIVATDLNNEILVATPLEPCDGTECTMSGWTVEGYHSATL